MISPQEALAQHNAQIAQPGGNPFEVVVDNRISNRRLGIGLAAGLIVTGIMGSQLPKDRAPKAEVAISAPATPLTAESIPQDVIGGVIGESQNSDFEANLARGIGEVIRGFEPEDLAFGDDIDLSRHVEARGANAFSQEGAYNNHEIFTFLKSGSVPAKAAQEHIMLSDLSQEEQLRALNGQGFMAVQINKPAVIKGTTYNVDGETRRANERSVQSGDIVHLFVKADGTISKEASLRADCINPNIDEIVPQSPETPTPPPVEETPPTSEVPPTVPPTQPPSTETTPSTSIVPTTEDTTPSSTSTSTSSTSTSSTSTSSTTSSTSTPNTVPPKEDDEPTPGPDDNPGTTQPAPEEEPTPDDDSENPVGSTSTVPQTSTPGTTIVPSGPPTTAPQNTQPTVPQG